jgi:hypothetical protein
MPTPRHTRRTLIAIVVGACSLAACGGSSDDAAPAGDTGAPTATERQSTPTTAPSATPTTALPEVNILTDFADVCRGVSLPGATAYDPARAGVHPIEYAIGEDPAYDDIIATMPTQWDPVTGEEQTTELVACLARTSSTLVETCSGYQNDDGTDSGNTVEMYDATYDIRLLAATDGAEIAATSMTAVSGDCPLLFFFDEGEPVGVEYALPTDELTVWLADFVET